MEPETAEHAHSTDYFNYDDAYAIVYVAGDYTAVHKFERKDKIGQVKDLEKLLEQGLNVEPAFKHLKDVYIDGEEFIETLARYDIGTRKGQLISLTDVKDKKIINKARANLTNYIKANPDRKILAFYGLACHGIQVDGEQCVVIDQINKSTGFNEWWAVEPDIRR